MAITTSAKRALRVSNRRRVVNIRRARTMKDNVKDVRDTVASGNSKDLNTKLTAAYKALDKAAKRGIIKKGTADRKKSRLAKAVSSVTKKK